MFMVVCCWVLSKGREGTEEAPPQKKTIIFPLSLVVILMLLVRMYSCEFPPHDKNSKWTPVL